MERVSDSAETDRIASLLAPSLEALGFELVRVLLMGSGRRRLQVLLDRTDGGSVTIDDCARASRTISALLDVQDPILTAFDLEVSSPGIDRPLTRTKDFQRFVGCPARLELKTARDGRRRFSGRILGLAGDAVRLEEAGQELTVPLADIARARLTQGDALLSKARPQRQRR